MRGPRLAAYASTAAHSCVRRGMEMCRAGQRRPAGAAGGPGRAHGPGRPGAQAVEQDRRDGARPFLVVGTAGTVDTGAIDPLEGLAAFARDQGLWFHVDGAYGALGLFAPALAPRLEGIRQADSIAMDFHKWGQVPYDAGYLLVRDGALQQAHLRLPGRATCAVRPGAWPGDRPGPAISGPTCPGASGP